jgi:hypothetical protein
MFHQKCLDYQPTDRLALVAVTPSSGLAWGPSAAMTQRSLGRFEKLELVQLQMHRFEAPPV